MDERTLAEWVSENWSEDITLGEWWRRLYDAGLAFPTWPTGYGGRDASLRDVLVRNQVFRDAGALGSPSGLGVQMGGPVVAQFGTDDQKDRFLPALGRGEESWCQFFSEPGAGSDLAGLATKAERHGDEWIVNGQKVWTSGSQIAARGMLVARTDWDVPKHKGLSYFIIEVDQPGIEIRPLKQMNGDAHFAEVFFTDARVHNDDLIGGEGAGWACAVTTLAFERAGIPGGTGAIPHPTPGRKAGLVDLTVAEVTERTRAGAGQRRRPPSHSKMMLETAQANGKLDDPVIRQRIADLVIRERTLRNARTMWGARRGGRAEVQAAIAKLTGSELQRQASDLGRQIRGPSWLTDRAFSYFVASVPSSSIAGGTDEVQRNIIGERGLGLPKEPQVDRDVPFREVKRGG